MSLIRISVSAWNQVQRYKQWTRTAMWTTLLTFGSILAIYHTLHILLSESETNEATTKEFNGNNYSITFCLRSLKLYKYNINIYEKMKNLNASCNEKKPSLFCLSLLSEEDRYNTGYSILDYVEVPIDTYWPTLPVFNNLYYGNCGTFKIDWKFKRSSQLEFNIGFNNKMEAFPVMVVHEDGTSPAFESQNIISINAKDNHITLVSQIVNYKDTGNWWFSGTNCEDTPNTIESWAILKTSSKYSYKYSQQACLDQCLHQLTTKYCKCILPKTMTGSNTQQLPICSGCNDIPNGELNSLCNCKPSCENVEFRAIRKHLATTIQEIHKTIFDMPNRLPLGVLKNGLNLNQEKRSAETKPKHGLIIVTHQNPSNGNHSSKPKGLIMVTTPASSLYLMPFEGEDEISTTLNDRLQIKPKQTLVLTPPDNGFHFMTNELPYETNDTPENDREKQTLNNIHSWSTITIDDGLILTKRQSKEPAKKLESLLSAVGEAWSLWVGFSLSVVFSVTIAFCFSKLNNRNPKLNLFLHKLTFNSAILLLAAICLAQMSSIIEEYYRFKVKEVISTEFPNATDLPPVYVCFPDNTFIPALNTGVAFSAFPRLRDYIESCEFQTHSGNTIPCKTKAIQFYANEYVINCARIEPMDSIDKDERFAGLNMGLKFITLDMFSGATRILVTFNQFAIFHTAIVRMPADQIYIEPGDSVDLQLSSLTETRRLPEPYRSKCVDERSSNYTVWPGSLRDFAHNVKYTYNFEDCLFFCLSDKKDVGECECHLPCRDFEYKFDVIHHRQDEKLQKFLSRYNHHHYNDREFLRAQNASLRIRQPLRKKVISEKPALDLFYLSSQLGGISMFWLGMPLLALAIKFTIVFLYLSIY